MRRLIYVLLLPPSFAAAADNASALTMLNPQQQAVYQHFQMVQEDQRGSVRPLDGMPALSPLNGPITNYDAVVAGQRNAIQRGEAWSWPADEVLARYNEIEALKGAVAGEDLRAHAEPRDRVIWAKP